MVADTRKGTKQDGTDACVVWLHPDGKLFVCDKQGYPYADGGKGQKYDLDQAKQLAKELKGKGFRVKLKKQGNTLNRGSEQKVERYLGDFHRMAGVGPTLTEKAAGGERAMLDVLSSAFSTKVKPQDVRYIRYRKFKGDVEMEDVADRLGGILTSVGKNEADSKALIAYLKKKGAKPMKEALEFFGQPLQEAKRRTFKKAKEEIVDYVEKHGWKVKRHLKVPHATSPHGDVRLWFKPQAIYFSGGEGTSLNQARSIHGDIRKETPEQTVKRAVQAAKHEAIEALYDECPACMQEILADIVEAKKGHGPPAPKGIRDTIVRYYDDCREKQPDKSKEYCARVAWTRFCQYKDPDHPSCTEYGRTDKRSAPVSD